MKTEAIIIANLGYRTLLQKEQEIPKHQFLNFTHDLKDASFSTLKEKAISPAILPTLLRFLSRKYKLTKVFLLSSIQVDAPATLSLIHISEPTRPY